MVDVALAERQGEVAVESAAPGAADRTGALRVGDRIVCGDGGSARVRVGEVGWLSLQPSTRLRVGAGHGDAEKAGAFQLELERGTVAATIFAAPRVFALGTPGGIAVDLGCIYETTVADDGATFLKVTSGSVSFESGGRKVHVPSGAGTGGRRGGRGGARSAADNTGRRGRQRGTSVPAVAARLAAAVAPAHRARAPVARARARPSRRVGAAAGAVTA
ncbi:MAG: hypothetical protein FJ293_05560 [Planctomycetes bacterium]|nr:hypothetical protein [Planctomycetota bacterium]